MKKIVLLLLAMVLLSGASSRPAPTMNPVHANPIVNSKPGSGTTQPKQGPVKLQNNGGGPTPPCLG